MDRQRHVDKSIMMYKIVNRMVPDYFYSLFVFRSDTLTYNLRESVFSRHLPFHSLALIIIKEVCHTAVLCCGIAYPWICVSSPLLMCLNLS